jgi:hypothetical protein
MSKKPVHKLPPMPGYSPEFRDTTNEPPGIQCDFCEQTEGLQTYTVSVEGQALRLTPLLCSNHGGNFLFRVGAVLGSLREPFEAVFKDRKPSGK